LGGKKFLKGLYIGVWIGVNPLFLAREGAFLTLPPGKFLAPCVPKIPWRPGSPGEGYNGVTSFGKGCCPPLIKCGRGKGFSSFKLFRANEIPEREKRGLLDIICVAPEKMSSSHLLV